LSPATPILVVFLAAFSGSAFAQQCQCIDVGDIKARKKEATTAIEAYGAEMNKMAEQMQRTQDPLMYTAARRVKLQENIQKALNAGVTGKRISATPVIDHNKGVASTGNLCNVEDNFHPSMTACMRQSIMLHEGYHQSQCKKMLDAGQVLSSVKTGADRFERSNYSLVQYAMEEVGGYTEELKFLNAEEVRLAQSPACKPKEPPKRDYTAEQRNRSPANQKPADPVKSGMDEVRKRLGF
jgi:hypothetical protein